MSMVSGYSAKTDSMAAGTAGINQSSEAAEAKTEGKISGKTIGNPKLSEKAAKYYEELKKKYGNMEFILVSEDKKEQAKAQAAGYANASKMVVLVDEDKIERMAEDENYRKQYEGIIENAASSLPKLQAGLASTGANVKGFGCQVNDNGTTSLFAVLKKSRTAQKERLTKRADQKKAERKAQEKKLEKEKQQERLQKSNHKESKIEDSDAEDEEQTITVMASSMEELLQKVEDQVQLMKSDTTLTDSEKQIGQHIDYCG